MKGIFIYIPTWSTSTFFSFFVFVTEKTTKMVFNLIFSCQSKYSLFKATTVIVSGIVFGLLFFRYSEFFLNHSKNIFDKNFFFKGV